jgi:2'-5' RNA ligase
MNKTSFGQNAAIMPRHYFFAKSILPYLPAIFSSMAKCGQVRVFLAGIFLILGLAVDMRLFVAINFNCGTRSRLLALRDQLRTGSERGNFSAPENIHLTLAFLGECNAKQAAAAQSALEGASFAPFAVVIERIGRYTRKGGDIWWAGVRGTQPLLALQGSLAERLAAMGFALDSRKYSPHITLGREVATAAVPREIEPFGETVGALDLMKSERINGKLAYAAIYRKWARP